MFGRAWERHNLDVSRDVSKRRRPFVQEHRKPTFNWMPECLSTRHASTPHVAGDVCVHEVRVRPARFDLRVNIDPRLVFFRRMKRKHLRTGYPGSVSIYSNLSCAVFTTPKSFYNLYFIYYLLFCRVFQLMKRREKISQSSRTNFLSSFEVELQTHSFHQRFLHEIRVKNSS